MPMSASAPPCATRTSVDSPRCSAACAGQRPDHLARRQDVGRPLLQKRRHAEFLDQRPRRPAPLLGVVPADRHVVEAGAPAPGQPQVDEVLVFADRLGAFEDVGLVAGDPQRLGDHPLGRNRPRAVAVDAQRGSPVASTAAASASARTSIQMIAGRSARPCSSSATTEQQVVSAARARMRLGSTLASATAPRTARPAQRHQSSGSCSARAPGENFVS